VLAGLAGLIFRAKVEVAVKRRYDRVAKQNIADGLATPQESGTVPGRVFITIILVLVTLLGVAMATVTAIWRG
jgi:hypothetical protein